ncbi:MAG TPA: DUF5668 domain-containing protein [Candidatus Limnocylindrales bacterium]|nr:DUF5668 domain-containing protein [Candidatus Limnocylindrales bacterium]
MHIDRRLVGFGLFLITVGGIMVAVRQGLLSADAASQAWTLWPLILVGVGLSIVLAGRPGAAIGGLVLALTFGAMLGGIAATGTFPGVGFCGGDRGHGSTFPGSSGDLGPNARVTVVQDCGDLTIGTVAGTSWNVSGESRDGRQPRIDRGSDTLRITAPDGGPFDLGRSSGWDVILGRESTIDLTVTMNGGQSRVNLAGASVGAFRMDANAGSIELDLREVAAFGDATIDVNFGSATLRLPNRSMTATLAVNAGSAAICLPAGAGLRVKLDSAAASNDFDDHGMVETNGAWETPGYGVAAVRLDLRADVNAGSLALDPPRQCAG